MHDEQATRPDPDETVKPADEVAREDVRALDEAGEDLSEPVDDADAFQQAMDEIDPLESLQAEKAQLNDQLLRVLADMDNLRKRNERQISDERVYAIEKFARDLLPVSDNMMRALDTIDEDTRERLSESGKNLMSGLEMTQKELHAVLARHGVTAIDAAPGVAFNPNEHQAVSQIPSDQPSGRVAQMFQSGWKIGNRVLRAAMVAVSAGQPRDS